MLLANGVAQCDVAAPGAWLKFGRVYHATRRASKAAEASLTRPRAWRDHHRADLVRNA
jgi:hypothetical protein